MDYQYPIDHEWSTDEVIDVIKFFENVEKAYEKGISREELMNAYRRFKEVVPGKGEEKKICGEFEEMSGYSPYRTIKMGKEAKQGDWIKMP